MQIKTVETVEEAYVAVGQIAATLVEEAQDGIDDVTVRISKEFRGDTIVISAIFGFESPEDVYDEVVEYVTDALAPFKLPESALEWHGNEFRAEVGSHELGDDPMISVTDERLKDTFRFSVTWVGL